MYSSTFIFAKKQFDDEFHRLDQAIAEIAKNIPGYLGEETSTASPHHSRRVAGRG